jgi:DNA-binding NarL/FixJ family response regulator
VTGPHATRILVVDDHPLIRSGIVNLIDRQEDLTVCGEAGDAIEATEAVRKLAPDLVLLDLFLRSKDGFETIKQWRSLFPAVPILVLSAHEESLYAERVLRAGARGYIMKIEAADEVLTAIHAVLSGEIYVSRRVAVQALHRALDRNSTATEDPGVAKLTDRELHVFQLIGTGMANRQIARELSLSVKTIEAHRENIKNKLDLLNAKDLFDQAFRWVHQSQ